MKKIMFNDKYDLTQAVLDGRKTMTRRAVPMHDYKYGFEVWYDRETKQCCVCDGSFVVERSRYSGGEDVAIAQSYRDINERGIVQFKPTSEPDGMIYGDNMCQVIWAENHAGWENKMFVKAELMPHHIRITNIRVEHLQDISDEDCLREGVYEQIEAHGKPSAYSFIGDNAYLGKRKSPREAFAALIDKVSGKGTWDSNPLVWVYEFKLID